MLDDKHPGMKFGAYRSFEKVRRQLKFSEKRSLGRCKLCGEPASGEVCMACQILKGLDL